MLCQIRHYKSFCLIIKQEKVGNTIGHIDLFYMNINEMKICSQCRFYTLLLYNVCIR